MRYSLASREPQATVGLGRVSELERYLYTIKNTIGDACMERKSEGKVGRKPSSLSKFMHHEFDSLQGRGFNLQLITLYRIRDNSWNSWHLPSHQGN